MNTQLFKRRSGRNDHRHLTVETCAESLRVHKMGPQQLQEG